ncbi:hypothetical protein F5884DRAFT_825911 [Xylogone sp. PMI_703]|nr:hypothetical protein F5884DRAFT_825911 [Xylogone sp. PMI_703]
MAAITKYQKVSPENDEATLDELLRVSETRADSIAESHQKLEEYPRKHSIRERLVASKPLNYLFKFAIVCLIVQGIVSSAYIALRPVRSTRVPNDDVCNCGKSIAEALSRGCKYSQMAPAWLPPACTDDELDRKYATMGNGPNGGYHYWADFNRTKPLTADQVAQFGDTRDYFFADSYWHFQHCLYYWEKTHRIVQGMSKAYLEPRMGTMDHVHHCSMVLLNEDHNGTISSQVGMRNHVFHFKKEVDY